MAGSNITTGSGNVALGNLAGLNLGAGNGNIDILNSDGSSRGFFQKQAEEVRCDVCKHACM